jgi:Family of unknown function (DUF6869)
MTMIYCYDCRFENRATPCLDPQGWRDFDKLATTYIDELRARRTAAAAPVDWWAWGCVSELEHADPRSTLFFLLVALDKLSAETRHYVAMLAAGPLLTILTNFADDIIGPIEVIGRKSPKFRLLLSAILGQGRMKPHIFARIRAVLAHESPLDDDHGTHGTGLAVAREREVRTLVRTSVLDDLGGRAAAAAVVGLT